MGKPILRGTRSSVALLMDRLGNGWTVQQTLESYPKAMDCLAKERDARRQRGRLRPGTAHASAVTFCGAGKIVPP